jgi:hypothetical protein
MKKFGFLMSKLLNEEWEEIHLISSTAKNFLKQEGYVCISLSDSARYHDV